MLTDNLTIMIRNVVLLQFAILVLASVRHEVLCHGLLRVWKLIQDVTRPKKLDTPPNDKGFWEIDMTKLEP